MLVSLGSSLLLKGYNEAAAGIVRAGILQCCGKRADSGFESCSMACVQIYCSNGQTQARCTQQITATVHFAQREHKVTLCFHIHCVKEERETREMWGSY